MTQIDQLINSNYYEKFNNIIYNSIKKVKHTILVVDDEEDNVQFLKRTLRREYTVFTATSGEEALKIVDERGAEIALIISDQRMPNMTGTELAKRLMSIKNDIPIILCTGFSEAISPESAKAMGINEFVMKPIIKNEMAETIRRVISERGSRRR